MSLDSILHTVKRFIPRRIFKFLQPAYHFTLALFAALIYRFPSRRLMIFAVTGTKGKTTVTEIINAIWEQEGLTTAVSNTVRFKIAKTETRNKTKMGLPGRFFLQRFLRCAVNAGCTHVVVEVSSEAAKQFRHRFISWDGLVFTNLAPEHIESHGSFEKYRNAKLSIARAVAQSTKKTLLVVNSDDPAHTHFLKYKTNQQLTYNLSLGEPYSTTNTGSTFTFENTVIKTHLPGVFNIYNCLAAAKLARAQQIPVEVIKKALETFRGVRGRMDRIEEGQDFSVVVDYAHTKESLEAVYKAFAGIRKVCVLGNTGGGRDTWKRPDMARIAAQHCDHIILTNEDPYDENPRSIIADMEKGLPEGTPYEVIMDRRTAIAAALTRAHTGNAVLITGKGTDPVICGPNNTKEEWDDAAVVREELAKFLKKNK